jgi:hypothetical protein
MRGILLTAVATIGIGIALNTAISALMFPPSRSPWQRNLVRAVGAKQADANRLATQAEFFSDAFAETRWTTRIGDKPVRGMIVTANYFSVFDIAAPMNEAAAVPEIALSRRASLSLFSWPVPPTGQVVELNGRRVRIAGMVPESFTGAEPAPSDFWIFEDAARRCGNADPLNTVIARMVPGVAIPEGFEEVAGLARLPGFRKEAISPLLLAFILSLTVPCINVANLMLARALSRQREIGIRLALGASRMQVVRLLLLDGIAIGVVGAMVAFPLAWVCVRVVDGLIFTGATLPAAAGMRSNIPIPRLDPAAFAYCLASGVIAAVLFSIGPALRASAQPVCESLRGEIAGMRIPRLLKSMAFLQMSFCALLLAVSAALLWNVRELARVGPGYRTRGVVTTTGLSNPVAARRSLGAQPWVASVALGTAPFQLSVGGADALSTVVSAGYFKTLEIPLEGGRDFTIDEETSGADAAVISSATAKRWWPGQDPVGRSFDVDSFDLRVAGLPAGVGSHRTMKVVGVAGDVISGALWAGVDRYRIYLPGSMNDRQNLFVRLADAGGAARVGRILADPQAYVSPLEEEVANYRFLASFVALLSVALGGLMLVLALSGMYSMLALTTELRMREFAIRSAVGASPASLFGKVTGSAAFLAAAGALAGLASFCALDVFLLPQLSFPLRGSRLIVYAAVPAVMLAIGFVSSVAPGLRASRSGVAALLRESSE